MIFDLRDYTTTPGMRDRLIESCENIFFPEQERLGAKLMGIFRDADDPNRFIWLRGMKDMADRKKILTEFYIDGEMWKQHRNETNSWIVDSDNVLLLAPTSKWEPSATSKSSVVGMYSYLETKPLSPAQSRELKNEVEKAVDQAGGRMLVTFATDPSENNFPKHPIRTGEHGIVWFASFESHPQFKLSSITERRLLPTLHSRLR